MSVISYKRYALFSLAAAVVVVWHAFATRKQCELPPLSLPPPAPQHMPRKFHA